MRIRWTLLITASWIATSALPARADLDTTSRVEARELAQKGDAAFSEGRCDKAIGLWVQAAERFEAPTILIRIAQCQALLGRVVEATATLERVAAMKFAREVPQVFLDARNRANSDLPKLRARIAHLKLTVDRAGFAVEPTLEIDHVKMGQVDAVFPLNPGDHFVHLSIGEGTLEKTVRLEDGEQHEIRIRLSRTEPSDTSPFSQKKVGYMLGAAGLVSVGLGTLFGVRASNAYSDLKGQCPEGECPYTESDRYYAARSRATEANVAFAAGAALLGAGLVLVLTDKGPPAENPKVRVLPVGAGAAVIGSF